MGKEKNQKKFLYKPGSDELKPAAKQETINSE